MRNIDVASGIKLNLGAGNVRLKEGFVTLDNNPAHNPDILCTVPPIPLPTESCAQVFASHFIEHLTDELNIALFAEIWRILEVGGKFEAVTPYAFSHSAIQDPTHISLWVPEKFLYFTPHFAYLEYGIENRFQLEFVEKRQDEIRAILRKTLKLEPCECPLEKVK